MSSPPPFVDEVPEGIPTTLDRVVMSADVRLEVASALRITEHAAGRLMGIGRALVHRYPRVWETMSRRIPHFTTGPPGPPPF